MPTYRTVLALDPSGSYSEGKGTTGWCLFNTAAMQVIQVGVIKALDYSCAEEYWDAHLRFIKECYDSDFVLVMEDYLLYASKAAEQINSRMETSKLIGICQFFCWQHNIPYRMQTAAQVKQRWSNDILIHEGYIIKNKRKEYILPSMEMRGNKKHCIDALRHAVHFATFYNKEK